ncbi:MAG: response regulator transcription factor [Pseudomonadales bacterium]|jgi:DNA-binding NarL/FixJ family response regulator|nr:response regulator transcription factor [Pseudomonadales bacterium]
MTDSTTRILLADDHALMRDGLRRLLERIEGVEVVAEADDGRAAVSGVRDHEPDLVLLDVALPALNGLDACAKITQRFPSVAVLILSMYSNEEYVLRALRNGARGYVLKSASSAELEVAIRSAMKGNRYLSPEVSGHVIDAFVGGERLESPMDRLTVRQREILQLIAEGLTTREIAERLHLAAKTVETHRTNLMKQLDLHDVVSLVRFAIRNGLVVEQAPTELGGDPEPAA